MILKVKKFQLPCLDLISSPSPSMKIQIAWGIGIQKWLKTKTCWNLNPRFSVIFPPIIWIYMEGEGDEIKLKQVSKRDRTLLHLNAIIRSCWIYKRNSYDFLFKLFFLYLLLFLFPFHISRLTWLLDCGKFFCTVWCVLKKRARYVPFSWVFRYLSSCMSQLSSRCMKMKRFYVCIQMT